MALFVYPALFVQLLFVSSILLFTERTVLNLRSSVKNKLFLSRRNQEE